MSKSKKDRQDPHRPSVLDPADYVFVGAADDHPGDSYLEVRHDVLAKYGVETGTSDRYSSVNVPFYDATEEGRPNYRCHHCGKHGTNIRYFVFFLHKPTKQVIVVGQICAKKLNLASKEDLDLQKRAAAFRRMRERHQWVDSHQEEFTFLKEYHEKHEAGGWYSEFLSSLWDQVQERGSLTDRQLESLRGNIQRQQQHRAVIDGDRHKGEVTQAGAEPTEKQTALITNLCEQLERDVPSVETRIAASQLINDLKAEIKGRVAQSDATPAATDRQLSFINSLMDERVIPVEKRREARQRIDAGLTKEQASAYITRLLELPKIEDSA